MSWSFDGRNRPGCEPSHKTEANCLRHALAWRERVLAGAEPGAEQMTAGT
jgi:hypothetical protein